jgi:hypothetical protein
VGNEMEVVIKGKSDVGGGGGWLSGSIQLLGSFRYE